MSAMFYDCYSLNKKLSFNTKNVEDFSGMFSWCKSLNQIIDFDMSSAKKIDGMFFKSCGKLANN
ncbi:DUF285 domain-containing protein [Campylobacter sp. RM12651]|nr:DUF285 domain-containing protein [Campylobacter sp. RM12651]